MFSDLGFYQRGRRAWPAVESGDCCLPGLGAGGGCGSRCHDNKRKAGGSVPSALRLKPRKVWMARLPSLVQGETACLESGWCGVREFEGHRPEGRTEKGAWPPQWKHLGQSPSLTLVNEVTLDFVRMLKNLVRSSGS